MKTLNKSGRATEKNTGKKMKIIFLSIIGVLFSLIVVTVTLILIHQYEAKSQSILTVAENPAATPEPTTEEMSSIKEQPTPSPSPTLTPEPTPQNGIVNVLLLGIDQDYKPYAPQGGDYHTDSMIVMAVNYEENKVDMISLPRDTFSHIPGIKGIYKLNAAINCGGGKSEDGFNKVCEAASWMLGGVAIDYYIAFELDTVIEIGELIGGVDFDVEMSYRGSSGQYYKKGKQHLDGYGIYDYMRARRNATNGDQTDKGRMKRGRAMLVAIYNKLKQKDMKTYLADILKVADEGMYTNATPKQFFDLAEFGYKNIDSDSINTHAMEGDIRNAINWNFYFVDQTYRKALIKEIYGIDVPEQPFVSYEYAKWLGNYGFKSTRYLAIADELKNYIIAEGEDKLSVEQKSSYLLLNDAYNKVQRAYDIAALSLSKSDNSVLETANKELRNAADLLAKQIDYPGKLTWSTNVRWYDDPYINEVRVSFQ